MKKATYLLLATFTFLAMTSCALKAIPSEYTFLKTDMKIVDVNELGNGTVLIYNAATIFHKLDNTARLNVWIDGKPVGQIRGSEYFIVEIKKGKHTIKLLHIDVVNIRTEFDLTINDGTKILRAKPTLDYNTLEAVTELPANFKKFKYAKKR